MKVLFSLDEARRKRPSAVFGGHWGVGGRLVSDFGVKRKAFFGYVDRLQVSLVTVHSQ